MEYIKSAYSNWYKLSGRSSRAEYWGTYAFNIVLAFVCLYFLGESFYALVLLVSIPVGIGLGIRRMHDAGVSGWYLIIPFVNFIYALSKSEQAKNKWGSVPKESLSINLNSDTETDNLEIDEVAIHNDDEIEELEKRLAELQELKKLKDKEALEKNSKKEEIRKQIEDLKKELDEQ